MEAFYIRKKTICSFPIVGIVILQILLSEKDTTVKPYTNPCEHIFHPFLDYYYYWGPINYNLPSVIIIIN